MAADVAGPYAEFATLVQDTNTDQIAANANWAVEFNDSQYFLISSEGGYNELWKTDGTANGTELVTQVSRHPLDNRGNCTCFDSALVVDGQLYFVVMTGQTPLLDAWSGLATTQLWRSDGTAEGTIKVRDLAIESAVFYGSFNQRFDLFNDDGSIGVIAHGGDEDIPFSTFLDYEFQGALAERNTPLPLWPTELHSLHLASSELVLHDNATFFLANGIQTDSAGFLSGAGLYKADATTRKISLVASLKDERRWTNASLTESDGQLVLQGRDGDLIYHSDGTTEGTVLVQDAESLKCGGDLCMPGYGPGFRNHTPVTTLGTTADGETLSYDGDTVNAGNEVIFDIPNLNGGSFPHNLIVASDGEKAIGVAYAGGSVRFGDQPNFWISDGTDVGTVQITAAEYQTFLNRAANTEEPAASDAAINIARADSRGFAIDGGFFGIVGSELTRHEWRQSAPQELAVWQDTVFYSVVSDDGVQLWSTDGTADGTSLALDLGPSKSLPMEPTVWDDKLFFAANDATHGNELWVIDLAARAAQSEDVSQADINGDGAVNFADFLILSANFGEDTDEGKAGGDLDGNQTVDFVDFLLLSDFYG